MATKPKQDKVEKKAEDKAKNTTKPNVASSVPAGAKRSDIEQVVAKEPKTSFEERTTAAQPWLNEDGSQNVG